MAITYRVLEEDWDTTNQTVYTTGLFTPAADCLLLVGVIYTGSGPQPTPIVESTAEAVAWADLETVPAARAFSIFRRATSASPSEAAVTITCPDSGTYTSVGWCVIELAGVDLSGDDNGLSAIVQTQVDNGNSTSGSVTQDTAPAADSASVFGIINSLNEAFTPRAGWTEVSEQWLSSPTSGMEMQVRLDGGEQTGSASWTSSAPWRGCMVEVKAAAAPSGNVLSATAPTPTAALAGTVSAGPVTGSLGVSPDWVAHSPAVSGEGTDIVLTLPPGTQAGDVQYAVISLSSTTETIPAPSGWVEDTYVPLPSKSGGGTEGFYVFRSTSDTGTATFVKSGTLRGFHAVRVAYKGAPPVDGSGQNVTNNTTAAFPTRTTTVPGSMVVAVATTEDTVQSFTPPAGFTERYDAYVAQDGLAVTVADIVKATPGDVSGAFTAAALADETITWSAVVPARPVNLPTPTASLAGTVADDTVSGALAATLPTPAAAFVGTVTVSGVLAGALSAPTVTFVGTATVSGALTGALPTPTVAMAGAVTVSGTLAATPPAPTAALAGAVTVSGVLTAAPSAPTSALVGVLTDGTATGALADTPLPTPTAALVGTVTVSGALTGTLPAPAASLAGTVAVSGTLADTTLPAPTAAFTGTVAVSGVLAADILAPAAAFVGTVTTSGALAAVAPTPTVTFVGTVTGGGSTHTIRATVTALPPRHTATPLAPRRTATALPPRHTSEAR